MMVYRIKTRPGRGQICVVSFQVEGNFPGKFHRKVNTDCSVF